MSREVKLSNQRKTHKKHGGEEKPVVQEAGHLDIFNYRRLTRARRNNSLSSGGRETTKASGVGEAGKEESSKG